MRVTFPGLVSLSAAFAAWMLLALPAMAQPVAAVAADVREAVDAGDAVPVIVGVDASFVPESLLTGAALQVQRRAVAQATGRAMGQAAIAGAIIGPSLGALPYFSARVDARSLDRLAAMPGVRRIDIDAIVTPSLLSSLPLIHASPAWSAGYEGTGWTVAILDTGVQLDHPFLAGKIVGEACYSTGGGLAGTSLCPGGVTSSTLTGSGGACSGVSGCEHGTHVAGIAAGFNAPDGSHGVARGASIISMQVFTRFTTVADCGGAPPCLGAFTSDIVRGLDRVAALAGAGNASRIAAANLSLGGGWSTVTCDDASPETTAAVQALRLLGIATVVASGNNGYANALSWPACISTAVSVGAVTDAPAVSGFSNNAPFLSLYAPGSLIRSSVPGSAYGDLSGTSMAAPHVAGAWAVLKQARPSAGVGDILATLQSTGTTIADTRVGGGTPHPLINVEAARAQLADISLNTVRWDPEAAGAQLAVAVSTRTSGAGWVAASDADWLLVSTSGGSGNGTLTLTAAPVSAVISRQARVTVGEAVMTVTQYGATLGVNAWSPAGAGGTQAVPVTMVAEHLGWTATTTEAWLTATPSSGTGSGTVTLTAASRSDSAQPRTARATVAGRTVTVTQAGVVPTFLLAVTDWPVGAGGGTTTAALSVSPADAVWTTSSNATWLVVNPPSGTGSATVSLTATASTSAFPRTGTAVVAGQAITVTQAAGVNTFTTSLPASWAPSAAGGTLGPLTVDATLSDAPWTATSSAPWVTVTPVSGLGSGSVTLTAAANASIQPRTATVTVAGRTVTVTQAGGVNTFTVSPTSWAVAVGGGTRSVGISASLSDAPWTAASDAAWLTLSATGGTGSGAVTLTATANPSVYARTGTVTLAGQTVTVTQAGGVNTFTVSPLSWNAPDRGETRVLNIAATYGDAPWTATSHVPWLIVGQASGTGPLAMPVWVVQNSGPERTGTLTVAGQTVTVTQATGLRTVTVSAPERSLPAGGGTSVMTVTASHPDAGWSATSEVAWLTPSVAGGLGSGTVVFTAGANASVQSRSGTVTVGGQAFVVTQAGGINTFAVSPATWAVPAGGSAQDLSVSASLSDAPWTATSSAPWLTVTPVSGLGSGSVTLTAAANASIQPRTATVTVAGRTVTVTQAGGVNTFTVSPTSWAVAVGGGTRSVGISASLSDAPWTAASDAAWLTLSATGGTGSGAVTLTAAANPSVYARTGTVTLAGQTVTVTQAGGGNTFTVSPLFWNAPDRGETRVLTIAATYPDAPWTATAHVPWLIVGQGSGTGPLAMPVWVVQNSGPERTGTLTVAGQTVTVTQATGLRTVTVSAPDRSLPSVGGTSLVTVTASHADAVWSATSSAPWLTPSVAGGLGSGTVVFTAGANASVQSRSGTVTVGGQAFVLTQAGAVPTFTLGSPSWNVPRSGGRYEVTLTSSVADAPWTATTTVPWLTVTPASGVGTTTLTVVAARMPGVATRVGNVLIGGASLGVTQSAPANQPIDVTVTSIDQQVVTLRWVWSGPPPDSYLLVGGPVPGSEAGSFQTGTAEPMATFTVPRGTFYVCVIGIRNGERLLPSEDVRLSVEVPEAPSAPARLLGLANGRALELTWVNTRAAGAPTASVLEVSGTVSGVLSLPLSERFSFPDVPDGTYTFRVRAANGSGVSPASDALTMTFPGACQRPDVPESFQAYATGRTVTLRWAPPLSGAAATGYVLRVSGTLAGELLLAGRDLVTGAPPGTYVVTVSAVNACGTGPATGPVTVTVP